MAFFYDKVFADQPDDALQETHAFIHVRDVAAAHVAALRKEAAGGQRIIIAEGTISSYSIFTVNR